jgi:hypothetical protein
VALHQAEKEKLEQSERQLKKMQKRLREEELKLLRGEQVGSASMLFSLPGRHINRRTTHHRT